MPSLSSPPESPYCVCMSQKITELQGRLSLLYQIKEDEQFIDSLVTNITNVMAGVENSTGPCPANTQPEAPWHQLGAKPKAPICSTPQQTRPWIAAPKSKHRGRHRQLSCPLQPQPLPTENRFITLDELDDTSLAGSPPLFSPEPPAALCPPSPPSASPELPVVQPPSRSRVGPPKANARYQLLKAAVRRSASKKAISPADLPAPTKKANSPADIPVPLPPHIPPTTMIIGDSIIKRLRYTNVVTHCLPGATVPDILSSFPKLVSSLPPSVNKIILHVGTNDATSQHSEQKLTKLDFLQLIDMANSCDKSIYFSGPIPTYGRGVRSFSRILSLHSWLLSFCNTHKLNYIDNFNLFWNRPELFSPDGLHPSNLGSRTLADNLCYAALTSPCDK